MLDLMTPVLDLAALPASQIPAPARHAAQTSLFDWVLCGLAGVNEPVAVAMRELASSEAGMPEAALFGGGKAPARMAAMVNGATSHAIDFDDTHFAHVGHLSVGIYPAALALGEKLGASAADIVDAFLIGSEVAIRVGTVLGRGHYNRGFHQTSTAGAFGATVAAARLARLTRDETRNALGLCASRASGLKSQFGTMGKPLNAGLSAANGVEAVLLAQLGVTSCDDGLMGPQGFVPTHSDAPGADVSPVGEWLFPAISYKLHACCHGTHAMIEALHQVERPAPDAVQSVALRVNPRWLAVCNIPTPKTGLEVKFSYRWLAAIALLGRDTMRADTFTDAAAQDNACAALAARVTVEGDDSVGDMQTAGTLTLADGTALPLWHDLADAPSPDQLNLRLRDKARALLPIAKGAPNAASLEPLLGDITSISAADIAAIIKGAS